MTGLLVKEKEIVVPGEILAEGLEFIPSHGTYRLGDKIYSTVIGVFSPENKILKIVPINSPYLPSVGDVVIGKIADVGTTFWIIDAGIGYNVFLPLSAASRGYVDTRKTDIAKMFNVGDDVAVLIENVSSSMMVDGSMKEPGTGKLIGGKIIEVNPAKIPRIIGKKASMIQMIKEKTDCRITVGQNGKIWINGEPDKILFVVKIITKITEEAHKSGLTDKIKEILEKGDINE